MLLDRVPVCPLHGTFHNCLDITFCLATCLKRQLPHLSCHIPPAAHAWHTRYATYMCWPNGEMGAWMNEEHLTRVLVHLPPLGSELVPSPAPVLLSDQCLFLPQILLVRNTELRWLLAGSVWKTNLEGSWQGKLPPWKEKYQQEWARVEVGMGGVGGGKVSRFHWALLRKYQIREIWALLWRPRRWPVTFLHLQMRNWDSDGGVTFLKSQTRNFPSWVSFVLNSSTCSLVLERWGNSPV